MIITVRVRAVVEHTGETYMFSSLPLPAEASGGIDEPLRIMGPMSLKVITPSHLVVLIQFGLSLAS